MNLSAHGITFIKGFEKCRLTAFKPTPNDVWTIGWGHTQGVKEGDTCTQEEADLWFVEDIAEEEICINKCITTFISQNEFDALCSLCYNIGCENFETSTMVKKINECDFDGADLEFARWIHQDGKVLNGLVSRRAAEAKLFATPDEPI